MRRAQRLRATGVATQAPHSMVTAEVTGLRMLRNLTACLILALSGFARGQVDVLYASVTDSSNTTAPRAYSDAIVLWTPAAQYPLCQESHGRAATTNVRDMKVRTLANRPHVYWYEESTSSIWYGHDGNGNGAVDPTEFTLAFADGPATNGSLDQFGSDWWIGMGTPTSTRLSRLRDLNGDGDFLDAGERSAVMAGATVDLVAPPVAAVPANNTTSVAAMANGDGLWFPHVPASPPYCWLRSTPTATHSLYLCYRQGSVPALPVNPDFGTLLPAIGAEPLDRAAVDAVNDSVYLAVDRSAAAGQPFVFQCRDRNANGNANDPGEVRFFYNGLTGPVRVNRILDVEWFNGRLYVAHQSSAPAGPIEFLELVDHNADGDAMDGNEQSVLGRTSGNPLDAPGVTAITVVARGTFGASCVNADLRDNGISASGGNLVLTFADIPRGLQSPFVLVLGLISLTGDSGVALRPGCTLGLVPDGITHALLPALAVSQPAVPVRSLSTAPLRYPPLMVGSRIYASGLLLDLTSSDIVGICHSNLLIAR